MSENRCEKLKQEMKSALDELIKIAESYPMTSTVLEKKPKELRDAIDKFDEAKVKYVECIETGFEDEGLTGYMEDLNDSVEKHSK